MAKLYVVNRTLKGEVFIGNGKVNFEKGVAVVEDTETDLIGRIKDFPSKLGYEVYTAEEFKDKFMTLKKEAEQEVNPESKGSDENSGKAAEGAETVKSADGSDSEKPEVPETKNPEDSKSEGGKHQGAHKPADK